MTYNSPMKSGIKRFTYVISIIALTGGLAISQLSLHAIDTSLNDWYNGANGYNLALAEQAESGKPIALFFHADWCGSCKTLRESVLSTNEVKRYMNNFIRVKIEPEKEFAAQKLADKLGVIGYPTFFIIPHKNAQAIRVQKLTNVSPDYFIAQCQNSLQQV